MARPLREGSNTVKFLTGENNLSEESIINNTDRTFPSSTCVITRCLLEITRILWKTDEPWKIDVEIRVEILLYAETNFSRIHFSRNEEARNNANDVFIYWKKSLFFFFSFEHKTSRLFLHLYILCEWMKIRRQKYWDEVIEKHFVLNISYSFLISHVLCVSLRSSHNERCVINKYKCLKIRDNKYFASNIFPDLRAFSVFSHRNA